MLPRQPESPIAAEEPPAETDPAETFLGADLVPAVCEVLQALCLAMQVCPGPRMGQQN